MVKRLQDITSLDRKEGAPVFSVVYNHLKENLPLYLLTNVSKNDIEYIYNTGYKLFQAKQYEKALKIFIYISTLDKFDGRFILAIGLCYLNLKRYSEASIAFLQIKGMYDRNLDPHVNMHLAQCFNALHHTEGVIASLQEAIKYYTGKSKYATHLKTAHEMLAAYNITYDPTADIAAEKKAREDSEKNTSSETA